MDFPSVIAHPATPCVIIGLIYAIGSQYLETKPLGIILGLSTIILVHLLSLKPKDLSVEQDILLLRDENEGLKKNLMQVYGILQRQQKPADISGPPMPQPPGAPITQKVENVDDDDGKPYM